MPKKRIRPKGANAQHVYECIRESILAMELKPGIIVDEPNLVKQYGMSRTPIREAMVRLASEGLMVLLPNRGAQVAPLTIDTLRDYSEAMDICQRAVFRLAAIRRDEEDLVEMKRYQDRFEAAAAVRDSDELTISNHGFHAAIGVASKNQYLGRAYQNLLTDSLRIARITLTSDLFSSEKESVAFVEALVAEHQQITAAIVAKDPDKAETLGRSHVEIARKRFVQYTSPTVLSHFDVQISVGNK